jgi:hypothetical protein
MKEARFPRGNELGGSGGTRVSPGLSFASDLNLSTISPCFGQTGVKSSAAYLKFLHHKRRIRFRNFK